MIRLASLVLLTSFVYAHDHNPSLDAWYKSLRNIAGSSCCDGSDAKSVLDPDWEFVRDEVEFPYKVKYIGVWHKVHRERVVKDNNRTGIAKVWPVVQTQGWVDINCFLPGSGS